MFHSILLDNYLGNQYNHQYRCLHNRLGKNTYNKNHTHQNSHENKAYKFLCNFQSIHNYIPSHSASHVLVRGKALVSVRWHRGLGECLSLPF